MSATSTGSVIKVYGCPELQRRWWGPPDVAPPALPDGHVWLSFGKFKAQGR